MKKGLAYGLIAAMLAAVVTPSVFAITGNPASNIMGDSANTAETLVLRDTNGDFAAGTITATAFTGTCSAVANGAVTTNKIAAGAITTVKLGVGAAATTSKAICVLYGSSPRLGLCRGAMASDGSCTCE